MRLYFHFSCYIILLILIINVGHIFGQRQIINNKNIIASTVDKVEKQLNGEQPDDQIVVERANVLGVPPPGASEEGDEANVEAEYFSRNNNYNNNNNNNIPRTKYNNRVEQVQ